MNHKKELLRGLWVELRDRCRHRSALGDGSRLIRGLV